MTDPVSTAIIASAIAGSTGGITEVSKAVLVDSYNGLKAAIWQRFGREHTLVKAIEAVDAKPTSVGRQETLVEEVTEAGADQNVELLILAESIQQFLQEHIRENIAIRQIITGNYNATSVHGNATVTAQPSCEA